MHPDVGAIIGISLAGSVLIVALLLLCIMYMPCWGNGAKPMVCGNGNRRPARPSTSSRTTFANFELSTAPEQVDQLSARELYHQNQSSFYSSSTGIVNPLWQMHCTCHACRMMTPSQQSLNFAHFHPGNPCQFQHHSHNIQQVNQFGVADVNAHRSTSNNGNGTDPTSFQYFTPQLLNPSESPPPRYPGIQLETSATTPSAVDNSITFPSTNPPPYSSPKQ